MTAKIEKGPLLGQRHLQVLLLFFALIVNTFALNNVSVMVVAMTNAATTNPDFPEYDWTGMQQSLIISSFFWGYFLTQIPGGYIGRRFGAKIIIFISTFGSTVLALFIPIGVEYGGWPAYCGIRIGQGLFQGLYHPCLFANLAAWCAEGERNRLGGMVTMGTDWGAVISTFASGMIAASPLGWPAVSYFTAALGVVWCVFWLLLSSNSPNESKWISAAERAYIEDSKNALEQQNTNPTKPTPIPWRAILTSGPVFALIVVRSSEMWGIFTLLSEIPAYMNGVLGMDITENALFSAPPFLAMLCMSYLYIISSDILLRNNLMSLNAIRKTYNSISFWLPALGLIALGFIEKDQKTFAIVLLTVTVGLNAGNIIGSALNAIDLSPMHTGILMGIVNTFSSGLPIIIPIFVGAVVKDQTARKEWQIVFATSAAVFVIGNLVYLIFGSTHVQPWNEKNFLASKDLQNEASKKTEERF